MHAESTTRPESELSTRDRAFGVSPIERALQGVLEQVREIREGEPLPMLQDMPAGDPDLLGIAVATADGHVYEAGDTRVPFAIQSISKAFTYGLALEDRGPQEVDAKIDVEPSGEAFNRISLSARTGRPANPMINAGAITSSWLVRPQDDAPRRERVRRLYSICAGRDLTVDQAVLAEEQQGAARNRALGWMLASVGIIEEDPTEALEDYLAQCSVAVDCRDLALMGATLANGGQHPLTGERAFSPETVERVLSVMNSCGMYDDAGEWFVRVGLPAKSGVGGGIIAVVPGQLAVATFSPPLDEHGNSVRGTAACQLLSRALDLHFARGPQTMSGAVRSIHSLLDSRSLSHRDRVSREIISREGSQVAVVEVQGDLLFPGAEETVRTMRRVAESAGSLVLDLQGAAHVTDFSRHLVRAAAADLAEAGCPVGLVVQEDWREQWEEAAPTVWDDVWAEETDEQQPVSDADAADDDDGGADAALHELGRDTPDASRTESARTRRRRELDVRIHTTRQAALVRMEEDLLARAETAREELDQAGAADLLGLCTPEAAEHVWAAARRRRADPGEALELERESVVMVVAGALNVRAAMDDDTAVTVRRLRAGTALRIPGRQDTTTGRPVISVQVPEPTELRVLDAESLAELESEHPQAALEFWRALARTSSDDLAVALGANLGWRPGDHFPVEEED